MGKIYENMEENGTEEQTLFYNVWRTTTKEKECPLTFIQKVLGTNQKT